MFFPVDANEMKCLDCSIFFIFLFQSDFEVIKCIKEFPYDDLTKKYGIKPLFLGGFHAEISSDN